MGSHEVSEALVSKRATREAEREEMGHRGEPKTGSGGGEGRPTASTWPGRTQVGDEPAVGGIVPGDVATAVTAGGGTAGQRKKSIRTESRAHLPGLRPAKPTWRGLSPAPGSWGTAPPLSPRSTAVAAQTAGCSRT